MFSRVLFFLVKISLRASFTLNMVLLVENYSKSLQKLEDGIILVQLVIRVILQELKCLCHVREWTSYPCQRNRRLCRMNPVNEWKYRECPRCFRATKCAGGIHTDVLDIFPHAQTNPDGCRWIQSDHVMEKPYHYDKNIRIHCVDENLTASFVHRVLNMYSNSRVGFLVVASLYICRTSAWDDWFIWGDVYFLVLGKLEVCNLLVRREKSYFLLVLSWRNAFQFGGILVSPVTFLLWPLSLFSLVESLMQFALYISQTMSTCLLDWRWFTMNGIKMFSA